MASAPEGPYIPAVLVEVRLPRRLRPRAARRVRVHRLRRDDLEPAQRVARRGLEDGHADAAHHARLRPRVARLRVLPAVLPVVQVRDASRGAVQEPLELLVQLAEVAEHERPHRAELGPQVLLPAPLRVLDVVIVRALPSLQTAARALGAGNLVHLVQLAHVLLVHRVGACLYRVALLLRDARLYVLHRAIFDEAGFQLHV